MRGDSFCHRGLYNTHNMWTNKNFICDFAMMSFVCFYAYTTLPRKRILHSMCVWWRAEPYRTEIPDILCHFSLSNSLCKPNVRELWKTRTSLCMTHSHTQSHLFYIYLHFYKHVYLYVYYDIFFALLQNRIHNKKKWFRSQLWSLATA